MNDLLMPWLDSLDGVRPTALEYEKITTLEFLKRRAQINPTMLCMIFPKGSELSYAETWEAVCQLAISLRSMGVKRGERVTVLLPNTPHYIIAHYAILALGAIVVQGNPIYTKRELVDQTIDSGSKGIITLTMFQEKANEVMAETDVEFVICGKISDYLKPIVAFLGKLLKKLDDPKLKKLPNNYQFKDLLQGDITGFVEEEVQMSDVALLQYTGGTTGASKGATLSHENISYNAQQTRALIHMIPDHTGSVLTVLPLFHSFSLTICLGISILGGIPMVLMPRFNTVDALDLIEKYKISFVPAVPTMSIALLNHPSIRDRDLSSILVSISGGAALPIEVARKFKEITGGDMVEGYGLSETSPVATGNPVRSPKERIQPREGSIGLPVADTILAIVHQDDSNTYLGIGEVGEIAIKGPQVMSGYWQNEEDTKKVFNADGFFLSGDLGRMDEDGYFYIVDRKKDLIIVSGNNVVPREVEEVLYAHPKILEAAVAGLPHEQKGEMVAAWIVLKDGEVATAEEIIEYCKKNLAPYKIPKKVEFRDELPKTMIGKILRRKLKEEYSK
ncbi:MAG: long-chain fatty acid--CoA ligase [Candidatus Heimdallarchaeota archaeon]|nr:long-chain fatty acid--CoA ligase [Candidatus Heimdallarchaeota archaeon]